MSGHLTLMQSNRLPHWKQQEPQQRKTGFSTALCEKARCFAVSHGGGIPHFVCFPDSLTRKYLLIYSTLQVLVPISQLWKDQGISPIFMADYS